MFQSILAAIAAIPEIVKLGKEIAGYIGELVFEMRKANIQRKVRLELEHAKLTGDTSKIEERFRKGEF